MALGQERRLDVLLEKILTYARDLTSADAASLYLTEGKGLRFVLTQNDSVDIEFKRVKIPISNKSVAGYVARSKNVVRAADLDRIGKNAPFSINRKFDNASGYRSVSMLAVPLVDSHGTLAGVLQLINRRKNPKAALGKDFSKKQVIAFGAHDQEFAMALAGQAAAAIVNTRLYDSIDNLLESIVHASVSAIESRDPTTSGHSVRVAAYCVELAKAVDREEKGVMGAVHFGRDAIREIRFASLLHDFGKIGVREDILVKAHKLQPHELDKIETRGEMLDLQMRFTALNRKFNGLSSDTVKIDARLRDDLKRLEENMQTIRKANNPSVLPKGRFEEISRLAVEPLGIGGCDILTLLSREEAEKLGIRKGSLSKAERREIQRHVAHTYDFLCKILWTPELKRVPEIAYAHHEKIDGTGYPRGLKGSEIPFEARMMTICDIYDALTASDRPYKKAVPQETALEILQSEGRAGLIDTELLALFTSAKVFAGQDFLKDRRK